MKPPFMRKVIACISISCWFLLLPSSANARIQQAFLVQNSGWMEPYYTDPSSKLKQLVAAVAEAVTTSDDRVFTLAFNQTNGANLSPELLSESSGAAKVASALSDLTVARKGKGGAFADTDFREAITKTIGGPFASNSGIIWIFTNNKNSPNNDEQTSERNREFYQLLHLDPAITKTLVFPLKMAVQGKLYSGNGLMVYGLAYGKAAADALDQILLEGRLSKVLTNAPARLKPVDQDAMRIVPLAVKNQPNMRTSLAADQRTVILDIKADKLIPTVTLEASLENLFYPYVIHKAAISATLAAGRDRAQVQVVPAVVERLQPAAKQPVEVSFTLPMAHVPSAWSPEALRAMGKQVVLPFMVEVTLNGQQLALSESFAKEMSSLFPGDPISEVFTPPESVRGSQMRVPLLVRIQYPLTPVIALIASILLLMMLIVGLLMVSRSSKKYEVSVDGTRRNILLKPFSTVEIRDGNGNSVGKIKRSLGQPKITQINQGHTLILKDR